MNENSTREADGRATCGLSYMFVLAKCRCKKETLFERLCV